MGNSAGSRQSADLSEISDDTEPIDHLPFRQRVISTQYWQKGNEVDAFVGFGGAVAGSTAQGLEGTDEFADGAKYAAFGTGIYAAVRKSVKSWLDSRQTTRRERRERRRKLKEERDAQRLEEQHDIDQFRSARNVTEM